MEITETEARQVNAVLAELNHPPDFVVCTYPDWMLKRLRDHRRIYGRNVDGLPAKIPCDRCLLEYQKGYRAGVKIGQEGFGVEGGRHDHT